nr:YadA-like family protein [Pectobacterium versatile]
MSVGAGVGTFDGEQAIAIGSKQQWSSHVATQIGATWSSAGGAGTGAGIAIGLGN